MVILNDTKVLRLNAGSDDVVLDEKAALKPKKGPSIPGFTSVTDQILVREGSPEGPPADHPKAILLYAWGDGIPKHVAKYTDGFLKLFPATKQVVILGPIAKAMFQDLPKRTKDMVPVLESVRDLIEESQKPTATGTAPILVHVMSNTGAINYASTLNAQRKEAETQFPHRLFVLDSTPGNPHPNVQRLGRWSYAMTLGTAKWFPWPFMVTQSIWTVFLCLHISQWWLMGREASGVFALKTVDNPDFESKDAKRLYLYSKADDLITYEDIEMYAAESRMKGYETRMELFEGSGHVGHMRQHPEQYWKAIADGWKWATEKEKEKEKEEEKASKSSS